MGAPPLRRTDRFPGLHGCVDQLPDSGEGWTMDRRLEWLHAFTLVLDFLLPVHDEAPPATEDRP